MNMLRAWMGGVAVVAMVACSANDDAGECGSSGPANAAPEDAGATTPSAADAGLAASPLTTCEGNYETGIGYFWLHRTEEGCLLGLQWVLYPDGKAEWRSDSGVLPGTWKGDRFYFVITTAMPGDAGARDQPFTLIGTDGR